MEMSISSEARTQVEVVVLSVTDANEEDEGVDDGYASKLAKFGPIFEQIVLRRGNSYG